MSETEVFLDTDYGTALPSLDAAHKRSFLDARGTRIPPLASAEFGRAYAKLRVHRPWEHRERTGSNF
jgi:hypothetical protein